MPIDHFSLQTTNNGEFLAKINAALRTAIANCLDPALPQAGKRQVICTLTLAAVQSRDRAMLTPTLALKLAEPSQPPQFVSINVINKNAYVENVAQEEMFSPLSWEFEPDAPLPTLETLRNGEVLAEVNLAIGQAVESLTDPDRPIKGRRVVKLTLTLTNADEARRGQIEILPSVSTKFPPRAIAPVSLAVTAPEEWESTPLYSDNLSTSEVINA